MHLKVWVSYAVANYYANLLNIELGEVTFDELLTSVKKLPPVTFTTTTDGNHGKVWLGQRNYLVKRQNLYAKRISSC